MAEDQSNELAVPTVKPGTNPKVFISYSWTSLGHQERVRLWAEQLVQDGVEVILDIYDLKEGQDKYAFMERMVTDPKVTDVLVVSDRAYSEKADAKKAGVGTESQIISSEVYAKVDQSKFIPVVCEFSENDEPRQPFLPTFFKSRIWIDFSSSEAVNENWERLLRLLYGKPLYQKPQLGKPPAYITTNDTAPANPTAGKLNVFKQALLQNRKGLKACRRAFLSACVEYVDALRVRSAPSDSSIGAKVLEDCGKLKPARNQIVDWVLFESDVEASVEFTEALLDFLENLNELKSRPAEVYAFNETWFEAHSLFVYETFLYIVAALLKTGSYKVLSEIFSTHYLKPNSERNINEKFDNFGCFYGHSETLQSVLAPQGQRLYSPAAALVSKQADREDLKFPMIMQAELLTFLMACITSDCYWYPQTLFYASQSEFPFFIRATQHKHFLNLAEITGVTDAEALRTQVKQGFESFGVQSWYDFRMGFVSLWNRMNMDKLDSLK